MKTFMKLAAATATAVVVAASAHATTFVYGLTDHPEGALADAPDNEDYGLRLDTNPTGGTWPGGKRFFSFGSLDDVSAPPEASDFTAFLVFDSALGTAEITGTVVESFGDDTFGDTYDITYVLDSVNVETDGSGPTGLFTDTSGANRGFIEDADERIDLLTAKRSDGVYFNFDDDVRGYLGGEGWVGGVPANDFLFTATFLPGGLGGDPDPVPLPAAGWMLLAGVGGMVAMRRRKKPS